MKYYYLSALMIMISAPVFAQIQPMQQGMQPQEEKTRVLGSSDASPKWTAADIAALCGARWPGQTNSIQDCITRHQSKIGHSETPADVQELSMMNKQPPAIKAPGPNHP